MKLVKFNKIFVILLFSIVGFSPIAYSGDWYTKAYKKGYCSSMADIVVGHAIKQGITGITGNQAYKACMYLSDDRPSKYAILTLLTN